MGRKSGLERASERFIKGILRLSWKLIVIATWSCLRISEVVIGNLREAAEQMMKR